MSTFTLFISCLTTSNLPWFMDLTSQVPMQYCSLQHQTLFSLLVTSTTGCSFLLWLSSFFLELFLHWSLAAYWAPTDLGFILQCPILLPFPTLHGVLKARIMEWIAISLSRCWQMSSSLFCLAVECYSSVGQNHQLFICLSTNWQLACFHCFHSKIYLQ